MVEEKETVLVLHVKKGYENREKHILNELSRNGFRTEFILDGDMEDLSDDRISRYFKGRLACVSAPTSCAMKHLLACEHIVSHQLKGALVMEDDMILYKNFRSVYAACMEEAKGLVNPLISFEDSTLCFVPRSQRERNRHLYPATKGRFSGCLYYSAGCAKQILDYVERNQCDLPIDLFHEALTHRIGLSYYWCQPAIATQGTHTGLFPSSINMKSAKKQRYRAYTWLIKRTYKRLLYWMR